MVADSMNVTPIFILGYIHTYILIRFRGRASPYFHLFFILSFSFRASLLASPGFQLTQELVRSVVQRTRMSLCCDW